MNCSFQVLSNVYASIDIGNDTMICDNQMLQLDVATTDAMDYWWQDGSTNSTFNIS